MVASLGGLSQVGKLQGFTNMDPEAAPADIHGGPADPFHGHQGEIADPSAWVAYGGAFGQKRLGPIGPENEILGGVPDITAAGQLSQDPTADQTPYRGHGGPFPRGRETSVDPEATARQLRKNGSLRSTQSGAALSRQFRPTMRAQQDQWQEIWMPRRGASLTDPGLPGQMRGAIGGFGNRDVTTSMALQNSYDLDTAHMHRRYATGSIPGNYMWMRPGGRPMVKSLPGPARPATGPGPFEGQDIGTSFQYDNGAILQNPASEYTPPPVPYVAPALPAQNDAPGEDWY